MSTYSFRITTNGVMRNYRSNLMKSRARLENSSERVMTHRNFNSYAEDPTSASRAFQLRRAIWRTNDQMNNTNFAIGIYQTAWSNLGAICDGNLDHPGFDGVKQSLEVLNGATGSGRAPLGQTLRAEADSIIQVMNGQYAGNFVFAGADGHNVPFTWETDEKGNTELFYRGVNVNAPNPDQRKPDDFTKEAAVQAKIGTTETEDILAEDGTTKIGQRTIVYSQDATTKNSIVTTTDEFYEENGAGGYLTTFDSAKKTVKTETVLSKENAFVEKYGMSYEQAQGDYAKLKEMSEEATYVDIGIGMQEMDGELVPTSAYNTALSGINFLGFGVDEDGDSMNIAVLMRELGELAGRCDERTGAYAEGDEERANVLTRKLRSALDRVQEKHVELDAKTKYLRSNAELLTTNRNQLDEQRAEIEQIDPALAIEEMSWANYCYQAALKIGNGILSQSLIDYMS